ncbi:unnamed protein product [Bursaphelenchus xylophilus]|uniref:Histone acetyltransferase n=1 Tax=Bursaphelenchus xylophilus TaxID=6326 RepID=A0A1I7SW54_BURXY|nr:unnamed protein product [Bursaphelenchus xylophilus]CAG9098839.1 unnamed protein product [Bursaphelenchus xylophilus]
MDRQTRSKTNRKNERSRTSGVKRKASASPEKHENKSDPTKKTQKIVKRSEGENNRQGKRVTRKGVKDEIENTGRNTLRRRDVKFTSPPPLPSTISENKNKSPIAKVIHQKGERGEKTDKSGTGRKILDKKETKTPRPVGRPPGSFKTLHIDDKSIVTPSSIRRLPVHPESTVRNQLDYHICVVCKCPTLIRTQESEERDQKVKTETEESGLTFEEDPALSCTVCLKYFHLVCTFDELELHDWALSHRNKFVCQECIRCKKCSNPIFDPGNVQCLQCGNAYHEACRPLNKEQDDNCARKWLCPACDKHNEKVDPKRKHKAVKSISHKKVKEERPGSSKEDTLVRPKDTRSPKMSPVKIKQKSTKEPSDVEFESKRLRLISQIAESLKPNSSQFNCIGSSDSAFSHFTEEQMDEFENRKNDDDEMAYVPYVTVGNVDNDRKKTSKDKRPVFFYGNVAYRPKFYNFLSTILPQTDRVGFCPKCLATLPSLTQLIQHIGMCELKQPPGELIYSEGKLNVYEIHGQKETIFCRRLSLFAKTFIGSKAVHFETDGFKFYVLIETSGSEYTVAGYFSKEIKPVANNNLSCLLVLPWMQRKQYGLFLIDLSYQLSIRERKVGSPEHPLSDAGLKTYRQYWFSVLMSYLRAKLYDTETLNLREMKEQTGIDTRDILETMIIADMTFILSDKLQINIETPFYSTLCSLRRRYVKPMLLKVKSKENVPFSTYN